MPIISRQFHQHEQGMGDEDFHSLARDTDTGEVFVIHETSRRGGDGFQTGEQRISIQEFLTMGGSAQNELLSLIATLVPEADNA